MTAVKSRVVVVSPAGDPRVQMAAYLASHGFEVHERVAVAPGPGFDAAVFLDDGTTDTIADCVRAWVDAEHRPRVVVVTSRPAALEPLVARRQGRLFVLPAPAFGWDVVDRLRAGVLV